MLSRRLAPCRTLLARDGECQREAGSSPSSHLASNRTEPHWNFLQRYCHRAYSFSIDVVTNFHRFSGLKQSTRIIFLL